MKFATKKRKRNAAKRRHSSAKTTAKKNPFPTGRWVKVEKVKVNRAGKVTGVVIREKEMKRLGLKKKAR